ncbi:hypothetical protein [Stenomitos frigidus]|nr:hypothetical protein [Stenomitos frigidus]
MTGLPIVVLTAIPLHGRLQVYGVRYFFTFCINAVYINAIVRPFGQQSP